MSDDDIYYYCPTCNGENWLEEFDNLPTYSSCAYCGMDHVILAVTGDEMEDIKYHREY